MLKVYDLKDKLSLELLTNDVNLDKSVSGCYIGDLLSWVMANAKGGDVWLTVMGNINAIAVATLLNISCIILTDGASLDQNAKNRAIEENIPVFVTDLNSYDVAIRLSGLLKL